MRPSARKLVEFIESAWQKPDDGIWEVRGGRRHFTHSKMMAWVAVDRMTRIVEEFTPPDDPVRGILPRLQALRDRIHRNVCEHGFDRKQNAFTQAYNLPALDAGVLLMPALGFLPASDPRVQGTIKAIERELMPDGFVLRYKPEHTNDGLAGTEGAFLACSFWLVDAYAYSGRRKDAEALFERLIGLRNDLGLLSEEYEPTLGTPHRQLPAGVLAPGARALGECPGERRALAPRGDQRREGAAAAGRRPGAPVTVSHSMRRAAGGFQLPSRIEGGVSLGQ